MPTENEIRSRIQELGYWYHNIELIPGVWTNPDMGSYPQQRWECFARYLPEDLEGKSVLDLSCNSGYFSAMMKRRGAGRVVGVDIRERNLRQARLVLEVWGLDIELVHANVYNYLWNNREEFDYVLFLGLFYHLRSPLFVLDQAARIVREKLIFQTWSIGSEPAVESPDDLPLAALRDQAVFEEAMGPGFPKAWFIEKRLNTDPTNWWFLNQSCVQAVLRSSGLRDLIQVPESPDLYICNAPADPAQVPSYNELW